MSPPPAAALPLYCPACDQPFPDGTAQCPNDGSRLIRITEDPLLGREIDGRFELRTRIGAGGMGAVYRAWQRSVGREVAVKVIRSHVHADAQEIKRFMREAQLTSRLVHPNVVSVIDFGQTTDGLLYLAMELIPGRPLSAVLARDAPLTPARAVHLATQLCDALEVAHAANIVHRDLKPSNVMILDGTGDRVKVLDFGLARPLGEHSKLTASDRVVGTPSYMSPEAARDQPLDGRADLYSLGVVLYEMLSAKVPFAGEVREVLASKLREEAPPLPARVPPALARVVTRLLERDPARRHASAAVVREALGAALEHAAPARAAAGGDAAPVDFAAVTLDGAEPPSTAAANTHGAGGANTHGAGAAPAHRARSASDRDASAATTSATSDRAASAADARHATSAAGAARATSADATNAAAVSASNIAGESTPASGASAVAASTTAPLRTRRAAVVAAVAVGAAAVALVTLLGRARDAAPPERSPAAANHAQPTHADPSQATPTKADPAKVEPAKIEPAKVEPAKIEPAKVEPAKIDTRSGAVTVPIRFRATPPCPVELDGKRVGHTPLSLDLPADARPHDAVFAWPTARVHRRFTADRARTVDATAPRATGKPPEDFIVP
jgi:eukaryotic-like serine/threonine-protein kinase